jgi:protein disulfide-isomerase-like protein
MNLIYVLFCFLSLPSIGFSTSQPKVEDAGSEMPRENVRGEKATIQAVEELTSSTVDSAIRRDRSIWLIEFYAPWCHHCTAFASNYESLAQRIHSSNDSRDRPIRVAKINGSQERSAASRFSVRGYPSFFVIDGWSVYEYQGRRSEESLIKFVVHEEYKNQHVSFGFFFVILFMYLFTVSFCVGHI